MGVYGMIVRSVTGPGLWRLSDLEGSAGASIVGGAEGLDECLVLNADLRTRGIRRAILIDFISRATIIWLRLELLSSSQDISTASRVKLNDKV